MDVVTQIDEQLARLRDGIEKIVGDLNAHQGAIQALMALRDKLLAPEQATPETADE